MARVAALGARYLEDGETLVHGDYFPGSWVRTGAGVAVIDPASPDASLDIELAAAAALIADDGHA